MARDPDGAVKRLLLFTGSFPYSAAAEDTFLPQELEAIGQHFKEITLVPVTVAGTRSNVSLGDITVDTSYALALRSRSRKALYAMMAVFDPLFIDELRSNGVPGIRSRRGLKRALAHYSTVRVAERWATGYLAARPRESGELVFYTWWFEPTTLGLARAVRGSGVPVVTRAHGFDLYESRHDPPYIPFRRAALEEVSAVYADSLAGAQYLTGRYAAFAGKIGVSELGVSDPGFTNVPSSDGTFRILSCSFLLPVKRIDLAIRGLAELGGTRPDKRFEWSHIGSGSAKESLSAYAASTLPANVKYRFIDYPGREQLFHYYRTHPVDLFINVSESEGTPVAVMEAISVGIPVIATAVGGNREIIDASNGLLLSPNPQPTEIAGAIGSVLDDELRLVRLRAGSRAKWAASYNAHANYSRFARTIQELLHAGDS